MRRLIAALVVALVATAPGPVSADTLEPEAWPNELGLGSAPNAIRFGGADRYFTALAASLALRGSGQFPFDSPDRTRNEWWGAATCPTSIIVVAGDTPADALAAASLSDPTNRGDEPRLERVASADPFFDVIGETDRVDTDSAPIIVTTSGRSGAAGLAEPALVAATDLRSGGCTTAREAIIVGGNAAVPLEVEGQLLDLGYEEVFRVAGTDRFDTAARIAAALGTEPAPAGGDCLDETSTGGSALGFYGNAVIEYRPDAESCQLQGRSVLLVDGAVGADALAAGWWTSYWQVPVLLVAGDGSLPPATRSALETMDIDSIVVLGGTGRIPESTVVEAERLATAVAGRFAGADRYETSVIGARVFGGWFGTGDGADFAGDRLCLAASSGTTVGWPDALTAGPWCGRLGHLAGSHRAPSRVMEPVAEASSLMTPPRPSHDAVPVLLVPGGLAPTPPVRDLLASAFSSDDDWCTGATTLGCELPGFAVAFGGSATVSDDALEAVSAALSGGDAAQRGADPALDEPFRTELDLSPVYADGAAGAARGCAERGGVRGARWLAAYTDPSLTSFVGALDLVQSAAYEGTDVGPTCIALGPGDLTTLLAVSAAGRRSPSSTLRGEPERMVTMSGPITHHQPRSSSGDPGTASEAGAQTTWRFRDAPRSTQLRDGDETTPIGIAEVRLFLTRGGADTPATFVAQVLVDELAGDATGEAVLIDGAWQLAGRFRLPGASGGFRATLDPRSTPENDDDRLTWQMDAIRP